MWSTKWSTYLWTPSAQIGGGPNLQVAGCRLRMFLSCLGGFRGRIHLACQCLVSSRFFLWRRIEQENASVPFSHILQPKINPFLVVVSPPESCGDDWVEKTRWPTKQENLKFERKKKAEYDWKELYFISTQNDVNQRYLEKDLWQYISRDFLTQIWKNKFKSLVSSFRQFRKLPWAGRWL